LFVLRLRTGNDLRDQADLASVRSVTTGSWFSDCIGASGLLVVVGSQGSSSAKSELSLLAERSGTSATSSGAYKAQVLPPEPFLRFSQRTSSIHYFRSKTHVWGGFAQFRCRTSPIPKTGVGCIQSTSFCHRNHFFVFRNEHAQSTTFGPKLMFGVVSRNFVAARHPF
jgi:hypothetical protein